VKVDEEGYGGTWRERPQRTGSMEIFFLKKKQHFNVSKKI
jgi:hypothetical protein